MSASGPGCHIVAKLDLQRLVYICCASLRLLRIYINEIYPNSGEWWPGGGAKEVGGVRGAVTRVGVASEVGGAMKWAWPG